MKKLRIFIIVFVILFLTCCGGIQLLNKLEGITQDSSDDVINIDFDGNKVFVDGKSAGFNKRNAVYTARDIIYYETGQGFAYGEGSEKDAHTKEEGRSHKVVHITKPGVYVVSGKLSKGQIAVDLGKDAKYDPQAVVTIILKNVEITCDIAPAIIFYSVYECNENTEETASPEVNTEKAGANIVIADGTINTINGDSVACIYDPDTLVFDEEKMAVVSGEELHDYDGTVYSNMSMNINSDENGTGVLNINAKNEGISTACHLTINGGNINIVSGNDGINTNLDIVSVTTINAGNINIFVSGETGEGDGTDSNGWLVINGGNLVATASSNIDDCGIDSYLEIFINGGSVLATGHMSDAINNGGQNYVMFKFSQSQKTKPTIVLKDSKENIIFETTPINDFQILVYSSPALKEGTYSLWSDQKQQAGQLRGSFNGDDIIWKVPSTEFVIEKGGNLFGSVA